MPSFGRNKHKQPASLHDHIPVKRGEYPFIGREKDLQKVKGKITGGANLFFIFGAAKLGKDRLAEQVGHELVKDFDSDSGGDVLHAYSIDMTRQCENVRIANTIADELDLGIKNGHEELESFLKNSKEYHLFILKNCQHFADNPDRQTIFLNDLQCLIDSNENIIMIVTSRAKFKLMINRDYYHELLPLSDQDARDLLMGVVGDVGLDDVDEDIDDIVQLSFKLPLCLIQIGQSLKEEEYTPSEMVEILNRSVLSACNDECYADTERLAPQYKEELNKFDELRSEFFSSISFDQEGDFTADGISKKYGLSPAFLKQDRLLKFGRRCLLSRRDGVFSQAEGVGHVLMGLIGIDRFTEPALKNDKVSHPIIVKFHDTALSATAEVELELDKHNEQVKSMRKHMLDAVGASSGKSKKKHYESAIQCGKEILLQFVRPTERCTEFEESSLGVVHNYLKTYQHRESTTPSSDGTHADAVAVRSDSSNDQSVAVAIQESNSPIKSSTEDDATKANESTPSSDRSCAQAIQEVGPAIPNGDRDKMSPSDQNEENCRILKQNPENLHCQETEIPPKHYRYHFNVYSDTYCSLI